jgi:3-hydroxyisobutyrate dehydrogenase-like beta-hydroxyacid dehydrogenase
MTTPVKRTGMIGLGAMGLQMARPMKNKGFEGI